MPPTAVAAYQQLADQTHEQQGDYDDSSQQDQERDARPPEVTVVRRRRPPPVAQYVQRGDYPPVVPPVTTYHAMAGPMDHQAAMAMAERPPNGFHSWSGLTGFLLGLIPLGILMASMVPAFVSVPVSTTNIGRRRRKRSADVESQLLLRRLLAGRRSDYHPAESDALLAAVMTSSGRRR